MLLSLLLLLLLLLLLSLLLLVAVFLRASPPDVSGDFLFPAHTLVDSFSIQAVNLHDRAAMVGTHRFPSHPHTSEQKHASEQDDRGAA
ncbi:hypothetical protein PTSG_06800 [Salpingoeca rosetta]|uniref:Uncharacterized protein n=1 Tax=Salpingoeca rosetta (strain ATCC 50818 / BSB-021) TaxID=946362 RepID=F2UEU5_SALR5|nr:uncharacterized protein PTSG_06800 [Salpingoeca rosetta]EGD75145.1 hypothetical protein PTSG_06800 [Salpingoeca rosetta]|eukprot:XP_004992198.1 hypothetical protein PTSG_06800 [Salpingoeca rosetta]